MKAFPQPIWDLVPFDKQQEIIQSGKTIGAKKAAEMYCDQVGMTESSLYQKLKKLGANTGTVKPYLPSKPGRKPKEKELSFKTRDLTPGERKLLKRFENGEVTLDEVSRKIATLAFKNILENPASVKYADFLKTELLKIKQEEGKFKEAWGKELLQRVFSGKLPPHTCPKCGHSLMEKTSIEGEIILDEPKELESNNIPTS